MNVFVAGSTGAVGRILVPLLVEEGYHVAALVRGPSRVEQVEACGANPSSPTRSIGTA